MSTFNIKALLAAGVVATLTLITTITAQQPRAVDAKVLTTAGTAKDANCPALLAQASDRGAPVAVARRR